MASFILPLPQTDGQAFDITFELSGVSYRFDFYFNERAATWSFDLYDGSGGDIARGLACELDYDPLAFVSDNRIPAGLLLFTTGSSDSNPAGRNELGERVVLFYDDLINNA